MAPTPHDDERLRELMRANGIPEEQIAEALEQRDDLLSAEDIRAKLSPAVFDADDVSAAIAAISDRGVTLSKIDGRQLYTFADYQVIYEEVIQRKLRRYEQSPHLQAVHAAMITYTGAHKNNAPTATQTAARDQLEESVKTALHGGARLRDIATYAGVSVSTIEQLRDKNL